LRLGWEAGVVAIAALLKQELGHQQLGGEVVGLALPPHPLPGVHVGGGAERVLVYVGVSMEMAQLVGYHPSPLRALVGALVHGDHANAA
jgi:hypothetical protein